MPAHLFAKITTCIAAIAVALVVSSCGFVYRMPVQQGNVVSKEELEKIKVGMSKNEVRNSLGTALIQDVFHASRWDFFYGYGYKGSMTARHKVTLNFDGDRLASIDGTAPAEKDIKAYSNRPQPWQK
jgi:outer membrane protein assembly factor BamE